MSRLIRLTTILVLLLAALPVLPATAQTAPLCVEGTQKSGAVEIARNDSFWNRPPVPIADSCSAIGRN